ncbi:hypothetical protein COY62_00030 [bacterium (Candidatus Howlettbacteria) CG_4_10_14_0_8_um_filter_40_9]|nr:MAG: hypothetical protein COY62_00030 [bacterium (Candidatus Howlettbacteria) CG_4_10_14_0_8_um_filter_40_9]
MERGLKGLKIYQMACELERKVHETVKGFPAEEKFRKTDQVIRASSSVCDNISEGYGKFSYQSKIHSYYTARGEAEEAREQIVRAGNIGILNKEKSQELESDYTALIKGINGYIRFLRKEKDKKENALSKTQDLST